jgi:hypothetical protein
MSLTYQIADIVIGGLVAGLMTFALGAVISPYLAIAMGAFFAAMYYFSRNPWGSPNGDEYNDAIDDVYERFLP